MAIPAPGERLSSQVCLLSAGPTGTVYPWKSVLATGLQAPLGQAGLLHVPLRLSSLWTPPGVSESPLDWID